MQSDDEEQTQEEEQQPQNRTDVRPRNNKYARGTGRGTGMAARRTGTINRDGSVSPVSSTFGTATGSLSQPLPQFTPEQLDGMKEANSAGFGKRPGRLDARPRNNIYMPGTGPGTGRTAIRVGTINRDGSTSPVSSTFGSATGSLSQRSSRLMTPRPTPADAYKQRQSNVALAKANGTFDAARQKFNGANSGQIMDEQGNISKNPNSPKFDQVPDGQGGYKFVPVPPKQTPPAPPKPVAATGGLDGTIKASTEQFGSNPAKGMEAPKPLVPAVIGPSVPALGAVTGNNHSLTHTTVPVPQTSSVTTTGAATPPSSLGMPNTGTLQANTQPLGIGSGGMGGPLKLPDPQARAKGGPVQAGRPYLVGEEGPEIIVPKHSGTVVPNHAISLAALMEMKRAGKNIVLPKGAVGAKFFETRPAPQKKACRGRR
ncbi:MAG: hypothetical protein WAW39_17415 [Prosthecobacter sp.]|uniref:hypothetical protein n=1 Tax=Prosthecobacter sp. TaxID=1965333 RepID=UPI003BB04E50